MPNPFPYLNVYARHVRSLEFTDKMFFYKLAFNLITDCLILNLHLEVHPFCCFMKAVQCSHLFTRIF